MPFMYDDYEEPDDADCVDAVDGDIRPEHDFPPGVNECRRCGAESDGDGPDGIYNGEIR